MDSQVGLGDLSVPRGECTSMILLSEYSIKLPYIVSLCPHVGLDACVLSF